MAMAGLGSKRRQIMCRIPIFLLLSLLSLSKFTFSLSFHPPKLSRRSLFIRTSSFCFWTAASTSVHALNPAVRNTVELSIRSNENLGLEIYDVTIGSPPKSVVAIRRVLRQDSSKLLPGMVTRDFSSAAQLAETIRYGPYPVKLTFENLAAGGDAISDLGTPLVTSQDALELAKSTSSMVPQTVLNNGEYTIAATKRPKGACTFQSRRGDVLEIVYEARMGIAGGAGVVYDSSASRGTGQPYQMVLGSGDMLPGVDQGLYDMCPGEIRSIQIPPVLAYGSRGNKLFKIPPETSLQWNVELVSVNSIREGDSRTREEMEERAQYF